MVTDQTRSDRLDRYLRDARDAGCPPDQIRNLIDAGLVQQRRQLLAHAAARQCDRPCDHHDDEPCHAGCSPTWIGYGGARGGGKSHWGLAQVFCDDCKRYDGLKFLYLRKVGKAGREAVQDLRRDVLHSTPHDYKVQEGVLIRRDNGSRVVLGHFQSEKDIDNYLGLQYDGALIEEATQLSHRKVRDIATCVRTSKPGWRPRKYLTTNPGNIGHGWFKSQFIGPLREGSESETRFVQATVRDNRFVNAGYRRDLESLTGWQRRAWLDGDWDIAAGQYFSTWNREHHVRDVKIGGDWDVWVGFDYGYTHHTYAVLMAQDNDGDVYALDEHCARKTLVHAHADAIKSMLGRHDLKPKDLKGIFAGHDVFSEGRDGGTVAADYQRQGLNLIPANVDRINGAAEILLRLGDPAGTGKGPTLHVDPKCHRLIECLPLMVHNPHKPEDVLKVDCDEDGEGGDDAYDGFRYGVQAARKAIPGVAGAGRSAVPDKRPRLESGAQDDGRNRRGETKRGLYGRDR